MARLPHDHECEPQWLSDLSPSRNKLVHMMRALQFGLIEDLIIIGGEPVFDPEPRVVREVKMSHDDESSSLSTTADSDFTLRTAIRHMLQQIGRIDSGRISCIEIRHGLPFRMRIETRSTDLVIGARADRAPESDIG